MTDQHDQVQDEVGRALRIAVAAAAALADRLARARQEAAQQRGEQSLSAPTDAAGAGQLAAARDDAERWRAVQAPAAAEAAEVAAVIKQRTGLDVTGYTAEASTVRAALQQAEDQAGRSGRSRDDVATAVEQVRAADVRDRARAVGLEAVDTATLVELYSTAQDWSRSQATGGRDAAEVAALVGEQTGIDSDGSVSALAAERGDVQAAALDAQAARYDWQANEPGLESTRVETLHVLAFDARAQADLYRQAPAGESATPAREPAAASPGAEPTSRQTGYDSHERRLAERDARVAAGVPRATADTAMQADMARGTPPSEAVTASARGRAAAARGARPAARSQQPQHRGDRAR